MLRVVTLNIHKGLSHFNRRMVIHDLREGLQGLDADLVFDVRCLPNPFYTPSLRALNGTDEPVARFLSEVPAVTRMIEHIGHFLQHWLPAYRQENRSYLTVAIGCTGGQHRSVYVVEQLAARFRASEQVLVRHRSLAARGLTT
jgi:UPF0042 nucleotide-binding protein